MHLLKTVLFLGLLNVCLKMVPKPKCVLKTAKTTVITYITLYRGRPEIGNKKNKSFKTTLVQGQKVAPLHHHFLRNLLFHQTGLYPTITVQNLYHRSYWGKIWSYKEQMRPQRGKLRSYGLQIRSYGGCCRCVGVKEKIGETK